ncbi:MAG TPA: hypothetical protein VED40_10445 [Azospirillaceae bacterium]|nr:hypothetical protein [Azospirillaceae bacterium]
MRPAAALLLLLLLLPSPPATASEGGDAVEWSRDVPRPLAYAPSEEPAWLAGTLKRLQTKRPRTHALKQHMLFRRDGKASFLAVVWSSKGERFGEWLVLYRVLAETPEPTLKFMREVEGYEDATILEPTGQDLNGDGIAMLFVGWDHGGSIPSNRGVRAFRLTDRVPDVTPPDDSQVLSRQEAMKGVMLGWRTVAPEDHCFPDTCGIPVPVLHAWNGKAYRPACRSFDPWFLEWIDNARRKAAARPDDGVDEAGFVAALLAQSGRGAEALDHWRAAAERFHAIEAKGGSLGGNMVFGLGMGFAEIDKSFVASLERAARLQSPCPLTDRPDTAKPNGG